MPTNKKRGRPKAKYRMEQITIKLPPKMLGVLKELSENSGNPTSFHIKTSNS
jgi:predicted DNA-binding protein